jgi:glutathione S-transferase
MALILYHHPFSRAATVVWMLEEAGVEYELRFVDFLAGAHKAAEIVALNPMGKLPILADGEQIVTEVAAIGLYLADRYALGRLAPTPDDPRRGTYLRWSLFAPSVIEPGTMAKMNDWVAKPSQAGWGTHDAMLAAIDSAISGRDFILGDQFSMADIIFGGTLGYMLRFKMLEARPSFTAYVDRLHARPAFARGNARNDAVIAERGLGR